MAEVSSLYQESKRARLDREKEEIRKRLEEETEFSTEDLSLATVPGLEFDPKQRSFDLDELRPQPIIKKRRKLFTKDANKVMLVQSIKVQMTRSKVVCLQHSVTFFFWIWT